MLIEVPPACGVLAGGIQGDRGSLGMDLKLIYDSALAMLTVLEGPKLRRSAYLALSLLYFSSSAPKSKEASLSSNLVSCCSPLICVAILSGSAILSVGCVMVSLTISS